MNKLIKPFNESRARAKQDFDKQLSGLLRSMYGAVESEAIPERFLDLLERLDKAEQAQTETRAGTS